MGPNVGWIKLRSELVPTNESAVTSNSDIGGLAAATSVLLAGLLSEPVFTGQLVSS
jgi:hypothetical protein